MVSQFVSYSMRNPTFLLQSEYYAYVIFSSFICYLRVYAATYQNIPNYAWYCAAIFCLVAAFDGDTAGYTGIILHNIFCALIYDSPWARSGHLCTRLTTHGWLHQRTSYIFNAVFSMIGVYLCSLTKLNSEDIIAIKYLNTIMYHHVC